MPPCGAGVAVSAPVAGVPGMTLPQGPLTDPEGSPPHSAARSGGSTSRCGPSDSKTALGPVAPISKRKGRGGAAAAASAAALKAAIKSDPGDDDSDDDYVATTHQPSRRAPRRGGANGRADEDLMNLDPKRVKRILANRLSAARSKERRMRYALDLEARVKSLDSQVSKLTREVEAARARAAAAQAAQADADARVGRLQQVLAQANSANQALATELLDLQRNLGMAERLPPAAAAALGRPPPGASRGGPAAPSIAAHHYHTHPGPQQHLLSVASDPPTDRSTATEEGGGANTPSGSGLCGTPSGPLGRDARPLAPSAPHGMHMPPHTQPPLAFAPPPALLQPQASGAGFAPQGLVPQGMAPSMVMAGPTGGMMHAHSAPMSHPQLMRVPGGCGLPMDGRMGGPLGPQYSGGLGDIPHLGPPALSMAPPLGRMPSGPLGMGPGPQAGMGMLGGPMAPMLPLLKTEGRLPF